jgi:hypothetical protein
MDMKDLLKCPCPVHGFSKRAQQLIALFGTGKDAGKDKPVKSDMCCHPTHPMPVDKGGICMQLGVTANQCTMQLKTLIDQSRPKMNELEHKTTDTPETKEKKHVKQVALFHMVSNATKRAVESRQNELEGWYALRVKCEQERRKDDSKHRPENVETRIHDCTAGMVAAMMGAANVYELLDDYEQIDKIITEVEKVLEELPENHSCTYRTIASAYASTIALKKLTATTSHTTKWEVETEYAEQAAKLDAMLAKIQTSDLPIDKEAMQQYCSNTPAAATRATYAALHKITEEQSNSIERNATTCAHCEHTLAKRFTCKKCDSVIYCSPECQRNDWGKHKQACKKFCEQKASAKA